MNVMLINGSPHEYGSTYTALSELAGVLEEEGIQTQWLQLGKQAIPGCIACGLCFKSGRCFVNDDVNALLDMAPKIDALIVGSPVHYAAPSGALVSFLDRLFYAKGHVFAGKPAAAVLACRRGGSTAAFDQLNKYFTINNMPVVSSKYWNQVHGMNPVEVKQDLEGMQIMRCLGRNMAWLLKCIEAGRRQGVVFPEGEDPIQTNFIRS